MTNIKYKFMAIFLVVTILFLGEVLYFNQSFKSEVTLFFYSKGFLKFAYYVTSYLFALLFITFFLFVKNKIIYLSGLIIISISYLLNINYKLINGKGFGLTQLQTMVHESNKFTADVWSSYSSLIILSIILSCGIFIGIIIVRKIITKHNLFISIRSFSVVSIVSLTLMMIMTVKTANTQTRYPIPTALITTISYFVTNSPYHGDRATVEINPSKEQAFNNIIWILDESVGGQYLSINGYNKETTPYLERIKASYLNLGLAASGANCSAESNLILMSGIQLDELPDKEFKSLKTPNIFQYAKKAGYKTHYLSGQSNNLVLQNHMSTFDLKFIDNFYQPMIPDSNPEIPEEDLIEKTNLALKENSKNFIFMVKRGAHFHWEGRYPKDKTLFKPPLKSNDNLVEENKEKAFNSYANIIKYTVDDFFEKFFKDTHILNDENTLIIYTSDHGQSIVEGSSFGTHCDSVDPNVSQGVVPLLLFTNPDNLLFSNIELSKHSHFEIFPTTLKLMGYEVGQENTLLDKPKTDPTFFSGDIFGRTHTYKTSIIAR